MNFNNHDPDEIYFQGTVCLRRTVNGPTHSVFSSITIPFKFPSGADFQDWVDNFVATFYPGWYKVRATHGVHTGDD